MYWYVIFTKIGCENKVYKLLRKQLDLDISVPFIPLLETIYKKSGQIKKETKPLFPGYVFIESELSDMDFTQLIRSFSYYSCNYFRLLRYSNREVAVRDSEKKLLLNLCDDDYCIKTSTGVSIGDKIHISSGPLMGLESIIKKVNRHKRLALIEINFMGDIRLVNITLDVIKKI